jgi:hypothetical protein
MKVMGNCSQPHSQAVRKTEQNFLFFLLEMLDVKRACHWLQSLCRTSFVENPLSVYFTDKMVAEGAKKRLGLVC